MALSIFVGSLLIEHGHMDCSDPHADFLYAPCLEGFGLLAYKALGYIFWIFLFLPVFLTVFVFRRRRNSERSRF
jgi:hypothetical protein